MLVPDLEHSEVSAPLTQIKPSTAARTAGDAAASAIVGDEPIKVGFEQLRVVVVMPVDFPAGAARHQGSIGHPPGQQVVGIAKP